METKERVETRFRRELTALLVKYDAELEAEDHWDGFPECGEDIRMIVSVPAIYDENHECVREMATIDLGAYQGGQDLSPNAEAQPRKWR